MVMQFLLLLCKLYQCRILGKPLCPVVGALCVYRAIRWLYVSKSSRHSAVYVDLWRPRVSNKSHNLEPFWQTENNTTSVSRGLTCKTFKQSGWQQASPWHNGYLMFVFHRFCSISMLIIPTSNLFVVLNACNDKDYLVYIQQGKLVTKAPMVAYVMLSSHGYDVKIHAFQLGLDQIAGKIVSSKDGLTKHWQIFWLVKSDTHLNTMTTAVKTKFESALRESLWIKIQRSVVPRSATHLTLK